MFDFLLGVLIGIAVMFPGMVPFGLSVEKMFSIMTLVLHFYK